MKKTFTFLFALLAAYTSQSQTCTSTVIISGSKDTLTSGTDVQISHSSLLYSTNGLPAQRQVMYIAGGTTSNYVEKYYYNGTRLDSLIGFTDDQFTTKNDVYRKYTYDANNNLTSETKKVIGRDEEVTTFTYTSNVLTAVTSPAFSITEVTFNSSTQNLSGAKANIPPYGSVTGTFISDTKINPFSGKLGLNDDFLSFFNKTNVISFGLGSAHAFDVAYKYNSDNRPTYLKRTEQLIGDNILGSEIAYGCLNDFLTAVNDTKITQTSNISPNPSADGIFNIAENMESVTVRNLSGSVVLQSTDNKIDLSAQKSGIYILEIKTKDGLKMAKVVKE